MAAQAARQNLRMQKELKLLLTDPPPGASFPSLSDDSSASLTSIHANFKGPEGTVYDKGVFNIKIQIPERYPFQPPIVTFATPIYHPNIDTGGRICLDILNLPPKGSWQPSLNISTVLTSIGLLLSEPNPDDGLMHDASREYKYNRQAFDQKARSMTDKYARAGETGSSFGSQDSQAHMCPSTSNIEAKGSDVSKCETEKSICQKRFGSKMKLSLQSLGSSSKQDSSKEMCEVPDYSYSKNRIIYSGQLSKTNTIATEIDRNHDKQVTKHKLSLKVPEVSHSGNGESIRTDMPNQCSSTLATRDTCVDSPDMLPLVKIGVNHVEVPDHDKQVPKHKLSLKDPVISCNGNGESTRPSMPNQCSSNLATRDASMDSPNLLPVVKIGVNHDQDQDCTVKCGRTDNQEMQLLEFVKMNQRTRHLDEKLQNAVSARSQEKLPCSSSTSHSEINPQQNASYGNVSGSNVIKRRKLDMISPRTSVEPRRHSDNDKENLAPNRPSLLKLPHLINSKIEPAPGNGIRCNGRMGMQALSVGQKLTGKDVKQPLESVDGITISRSNLKLHLEKPLSILPKILNTIHDPQLDEKQQVHQVNVVESMGEFKQHSIGSPVPEATIVLDSEDSEDENVPVRSKLSLARKRLSLKRRHV